MKDAMYDVRQEQYPTVIREMIRHENDVTNHRIMWLLIGQGFIGNAYVSALSKDTRLVFVLSLLGILVALSAFLMLYKSYLARGYLLFLGHQAKQGKLQEENLPLMGWPKKRIKDWWRDVWVCPWIAQTGDAMEPWLILPYFFMCIWLTILMRLLTRLDIAVDLTLAAILTGVIFFACCIVLVWSRGGDQECTEDRTLASKSEGYRETVS
jgi:hypothetical protein